LNRRVAIIVEKPGRAHFTTVLLRTIDHGWCDGYTGKYAAGNISGLLQGQLSIKSMLTLIAGLLVIGVFLFVGLAFSSREAQAASPF